MDGEMAGLVIDVIGQSVIDDNERERNRHGLDGARPRATVGTQWMSNGRERVP
jgi:hypothetical protein